MFVGLVRPVLMSRFTQHQNFDQLVRQANLVLLANFVLLFAPLSVLLVSGNELLNWATDAKFGDLSLLVAGFYVVLLVTSVNNLLDLLVKAVEQNRVYMFSNLFLSGSLLLAVPLIPFLGLWAIAVANLVGLVVSLSIVNAYLRRRGYRYRFEWGHGFAVAGSSLVAAGVGVLSVWTGAHFVVATFVTLAVYAGLVLKALPVTKEEKRSMMEILPMRLRTLVSRGAAQ
jgi:O-antigen/teichoic acid export membrane protein